MSSTAIARLPETQVFSREWFGQRKVISALSVAAFVLLWEIVPALGLLDPFYTSSPSRVIMVAFEIVGGDDGFFRHCYVSLVEFLGGFALAVLVGVPGGFLLGASKTLRHFIDPPLMALYATPRLALLPVLIVWLGIGMESKIAVVFIGASIPIMVNSVAGIRGVDGTLVRLAKSFCAKRHDVFFKILLPGSLPAVMTGLRLGLGRGVLGVIVGEMYVAQEGVGHQIMQYGASIRVDHLMFYTLLVSFFGFAATSGIRRAEEYFARWKPE